VPGCVVEQAREDRRAVKSRKAKTDGLSNLGKHSHSTDPSRLTSAAELQSDSSACSAIGVELTIVLFQTRRAPAALLWGNAVPGERRRRLA
jgi:hypothetical protein